MAGHYSPPPTEFEKELWEQHAQRAAQASAESNKRPPTPRPSVPDALTRLIEECQRTKHNDEDNQPKEYADRMHQVMAMTVEQTKKNALRELELLKAKHETELVKQQMEMLKVQRLHELEMAKVQQELKELRAHVQQPTTQQRTTVQQPTTIESPVPAVWQLLAINKLTGDVMKLSTHLEMLRHCDEWKAKIAAGKMTEAEENALGVEMLQTTKMLPELVNMGAICIAGLSWGHLRTLVGMNSKKGKTLPLVLVDNNDRVLCRESEGDGVFAFRISASTKNFVIFVDE